MEKDNTMKKLSPVEQSSKLKVLQDCMDDMDGMMGEGLDAKKKMKVSVAASSPVGLKKGLEKAEEVIGDHAMMESDEVEGEEVEEEMSEEELDAKIAELMAMKAALKA